jgi:hypothetical protein
VRYEATFHPSASHFPVRLALSGKGYRFGDTTDSPYRLHTSIVAFPITAEMQIDLSVKNIVPLFTKSISTSDVGTPVTNDTEQKIETAVVSADAKREATVPSAASPPTSSSTSSSFSWCFLPQYPLWWTLLELEPRLMAVFTHYLGRDNGRWCMVGQATPTTGVLVSPTNDADRIIHHDIPTFGGSLGAPLVDVATGKLLGMHVAPGQVCNLNSLVFPVISPVTSLSLTHTHIHIRIYVRTRFCGLLCRLNSTAFVLTDLVIAISSRGWLLTCYYPIARRFASSCFLVS